MSVVSALGDLKKFAKFKSRANVSSLIFDLHRLTASLLIVSSILTTSRQFFGDPIHCFVGGHISLNVFQSYCFMTATYTLPRMVSNTSSSHPGVGTGVVHAGGAEEGTVYHNYYQWVCLLLAVQASICYLPWAVWKGIEDGRVGKLLVKVSQDPLTETPLSDQVESLGNFLHSHRGWFNSCALKLLFCQVVALAFTVGQMYLMDLVLANQFLSFGSHFFSLGMLSEALNVVFPKVVKCSMSYHGVSGNIENNSGMCTLPINIVNEKIYLVLWLWFTFLACISAISLVYQSILLLFPSTRKMEIQIRSRSSQPHQVGWVVDQSTYGDVVLLQLIAKNTDTAQFTALLNHLNNAPSLPLPSFLQESFHSDEKGLLATGSGRKEV